MSRFFVPASAVGGTAVRITDKKDLHHLTDVLRAAKGDSITVCGSDGWEYDCVIESVGREEVTARITDKSRGTEEPSTKVTLFQGIPKGSKLDDLTRKAVELGVSSIVPVFMDRTVVRDRGGFEKKTARLRKIAEEAAKQSRRSVIPEISGPVDFGKMLAMLGDEDAVIFCYENEERKTLKQALRSLRERPGRIGLVIGPEGGFSPEEADALREVTGMCVTLGNTVLRTETAGPAALSMILYELEMRE